GFWPVLQAYGGNYGHRLPTRGEERYMIMASLQTSLTGLFFWWKPNADPTWVKDVLVPIVDEARRYLPAVGAGRSEDKVQSSGDTRVRLYRDPSTGAYLLIAAHHSGGDETSVITIDPSLPVTTATALGEDAPRTIDLAGGHFS